MKFSIFQPKKKMSTISDFQLLEGYVGFTVIRYIDIIVTCIGLVGNLFTFLIFSRKVFAKNSINIYGRAMAFFDSFIFFYFFYNGSALIFNTDLANVAPFWCKFLYYIGLGFLNIPCWILVAFSIDKLFCVLNYNNRLLQILNKTSFQLAVVAFVTLLCCLTFAFVLVGLQVLQVLFNLYP